MRTIVRYALPCAGVLVIAGSGCAGPQQSAESPTARHVESAQQQSQQALDRAAEAQKRASKQGERVAQAQRDVQDAQRRLTEAQKRLAGEQEKAEQLQQQAIEAEAQATREAQASQQEASRALTQQGEQVKRREQTFSGQVSQAAPDSIVVTPQVGAPMRFNVTGNTQVQIDGRRASAAEIQQGGDARVVYQISGSEPTATVVQVITGQPGRAAQPPPAAEPGSATPTAPSEPSAPSAPLPERP
jgi:colicin import membrane protein